MTRDAFELHRDRFLGADEIALRFRHATKLLLGSASDRAEGISLAEETLVYDPYDVPIHRALATAKACDGDDAADAVYEHLAICHDVGAIEVAELRADRAACGAMSDATFEAVLASVVANARHRTRFRDVAFDEIGPNTTAYETRLIWKPEHHGPSWRRTSGSSRRRRARTTRPGSRRPSGLPPRRSTCNARS